MNRATFGKLFEQYQQDARAVLLKRFGDPALADDAVQNAAVYVLENIGRFKKLTKSYFIQLAVSRAKNGKRSEARQQSRVASSGGPSDLMVIEDLQEQARRGRMLPKHSADRQFEITLTRTARRMRKDRVMVL